MCWAFYKELPAGSFGAPPDDRMSITASEGESELSGEEDSAALLSSGMVAMPKSDSKIMSMLSWVDMRVGFKWRPPPCPKPSKLDDWFVRLAHAGSQRPTPVPFFLEVNKGLTRLWMATFLLETDCQLLLPHHSRW